MNNYTDVSSSFCRLIFEPGSLSIDRGIYYFSNDNDCDLLNLDYMQVLDDPRYNFKYEQLFNGIMIEYDETIEYSNLNYLLKAYVFHNGRNTYKQYCPKVLERHFQNVELNYLQAEGYDGYNVSSNVAPKADYPIPSLPEFSGILWHDIGSIDLDSAGDLECALLQGRIIYKAVYSGCLVQEQRLTFINPLNNDYWLGEQFYAYNCDASGNTYPVSRYFYVDGMIRYLVFNHKHKEIIFPNNLSYVYERSAIQPVIMIECRDKNQQTSDLVQQHLKQQLLHDIPIDPNNFINYEYGQYLQVSGNSPLIDTLNVLMENNKLNELIFLDLVDVEPDIAFTSIFKRMPKLKYIRINLNSILKIENKKIWNQIFSDLFDKVKIGCSYIQRYYDFSKQLIKDELPLDQNDLKNIDTFWEYFTVEEFIEKTIQEIYSDDFLKFYIKNIQQSFFKFHGLNLEVRDMKFDLINQRDPIYDINSLIPRDRGDTIPYNLPYYRIK